MSSLPNFPYKNQLNSPTLDGRPDENREFNCVPSCLAASLQYLTGRTFEPDALKDAVYGQGYTGGTSAQAYIGYAARQGVRLYAINGDGSHLVQITHQQLALGRPVIITEPDPYANPSLGFLHVVAIYQDGPGVLVAMDPFGAVEKRASDAVWASRIQATGGQIWVLERLNVPNGWRDDGAALIAPNGHRVIKGFREYVLGHAWPPSNFPLEDEHSQSPLEASNPALGAGSQQVFRWTVLEWTSQRSVFEMWTGHELLTLRSQLAAQEQELQRLRQPKP